MKIFCISGNLTVDIGIYRENNKFREGMGIMTKEPYDLLIKNAVYFAENQLRQGHILVRQGKIDCILTSDSDITQVMADSVIDGTGLVVFPGFIDSHVHFRDPGATAKEDFFTGSCAAAAGGFTTVCDMPNVTPCTCTAETLMAKIADAEKKSLVDFGFYGAAGFGNFDQLAAMDKIGITGFKTFLQPGPKGQEENFSGLVAYDDGELWRLMNETAKIGTRHFFHCENYKIIEKMAAYLHEIGEEGYNFHYQSRPNIAEVQSIATVLQFARVTGQKVGICHISTAEGCELVKKAKAAGMDVVGETCFHYLVYSHAAIDTYGPFAKCNPPLRSQEDVDGLWAYIADGTIDMIGSDHAPHQYEEKLVGMEKEIWKAPSGIPSIETFIPTMLNQVAKGKLTPEQLVGLVSEHTAKVFGLYPRKGCIAPGSDGDFTIIDFNRETVIDITKMYTKGRKNNVMFDGVKVQGRVCYTIVRGNIVMENGVVATQEKGWGSYIYREKEDNRAYAEEKDDYHHNRR